jgi:C4-dicarboxylate transporter DctQ subunit
MNKVFFRFKKFVNFYCRLTFILSCILLGLLIIFVTYEVIMRYVFNHPTQWTYEIDGFLYVAMVLLALGFAQSQDRHMKMDIILSKLRGKKLKIVQIFLAFLGFAYAVILLVFGWQYAYTAYIKGLKAPSTVASPLWPSYMALPIGTLGIAMQYILEIFEKIITFNKKDMAQEGGDLPALEKE